MAGLKLSGIRKSFGQTEVIKGIDLDIEDGEFVVFVGPSGCGKSTLLRLIAGLEDITSGELQIDGKQVNDVEPKERGIAMVFQSYAIFPHMSVRENMGFGLTIRRESKAQIKKRVDEAARMLQMEDLLDRRPDQLSGGQRQRVAIGRAVVRSPDVFLFDEPLSNLDAALRMNTRMEISELHKRLGTTMIYVTHDQVEAMTLADKIVVLKDGEVQQYGPPMDLFHYPANRFVAKFIGSPPMNFIDAEVLQNDAGTFYAKTQAIGSVHLPDYPLNNNEAIQLGLRPQYISLGEGPDTHHHFEASVGVLERLGSETLINLKTQDGSKLTAVLPEDVKLQPDQTVMLNFDVEKISLFSSDSRRIERTQ